MSSSPKKSLAFFTMLIESYPKNANGYDSMSDYYIAQKDVPNAIKYVEMAYKISGSNHHKEKLEKLKE